MSKPPQNTGITGFEADRDRFVQKTGAIESSFLLPGFLLR